MIKSPQKAYEDFWTIAIMANSGIAERQIFIWHIVSPDFMA